MMGLPLVRLGLVQECLPNMTLTWAWAGCATRPTKGLMGLDLGLGLGLQNGLKNRNKSTKSRERKKNKKK